MQVHNNLSPGPEKHKITIKTYIRRVIHLKAAWRAIRNHNAARILVQGVLIGWAK